MNNKLRTVYCAPGEWPIFAEVENDLKSLQKKIGGHIETVTLPNNLVLICDEEGILKGLEENFKLEFKKEFIGIHGPVLFVSADLDTMISINESQIKQVCDILEVDHIEEEDE